MYNIKEFRNYHHLSQVQLADALNVSQPLLSQIEKGARSLTEDIKLLFETRFGIGCLDAYDDGKEYVPQPRIKKQELDEPSQSEIVCTLTNVIDTLKNTIEAQLKQIDKLQSQNDLLMSQIFGHGK